MTAKQIRDYVSVSLIVHMYATNPQLVMEAVGNDTAGYGSTSQLIGGYP